MEREGLGVKTLLGDKNKSKNYSNVLDYIKLIYDCRTIKSTMANDMLLFP